VNYFTDCDGNLSQTPLIAALKDTRDQPGLWGRPGGAEM